MCATAPARGANRRFLNTTKPGPAPTPSPHRRFLNTPKSPSFWCLNIGVYFGLESKIVAKKVRDKPNTWDRANNMYFNSP